MTSIGRFDAPTLHNPRRSCINDGGYPAQPNFVNLCVTGKPVSIPGMMTHVG